MALWKEILLSFALTIFLPFSAVIKAQNDKENIIESPLITNFGSWGDWAMCPLGTFAEGFQLKTAKFDPVPEADNTAVNGIRLHCSPAPGQPAYRFMTSLVGVRGEWGPLTLCNGQFMTGFQLEVVPYKGTKMRLWKSDTDDVATINVHGFYGGDRLCFSEEVKDYCDLGGQWTPILQCKQDFLVCGIKTQVDESSFQADKTGLNNVQMKCCNKNETMATAAGAGK